MTQQFKYRWPTKLKKFGIEDPFLKLLVAKYENEIPWQKQVIDTGTLKQFLSDQMLPNLMQRIAYPVAAGTKHVYLHSRDVNVDAVLANEHSLLPDEELAFIMLLQQEEGDQIAKEYLADLLNQQKAQGFEAWCRELNRRYKDNLAFTILLLRPIVKLSPRRTRRVVVEPHKDVIDWLYRRIERGRSSPNEELARVYCTKLGSGGRKIPFNGWQYVPQGVENATRLSAACRGSGWCVESPQWARNYLYSGNFYVLRHRNQPVVALRVQDNLVIECQGRGNSSPEGWFVEIDLFSRTNKFELNHRVEEMQAARFAQGNYAIKSTEWWRERIQFWPFAAALAPQAIRDENAKEIREVVLEYMRFPAFDSLAQSLDLEFDENDWSKAISLDPLLYSSCPDRFKENKGVIEACVTSWCDSYEENELTLDVISMIPEFVKSSERFRAAFQNVEPAKQWIRQRPRSRRERENRFQITEYVDLTAQSPAEVIREYILNWLLNNEDGEFSKSNLTEVVRHHPDFARTYEQAWREAVEVQPPFFLAIPDELDQIKPVETAKGRVNLDNWCVKVREKPWLLTQKTGVPKSIRSHRRVIDSYRSGWLPYLRKYPFRIWVKRGKHNRVYMSYALLADDKVISSMVEGWESRRTSYGNNWDRASLRMKKIPAIQISVLRAIAPDWNERKYGFRQKQIAQEIKELYLDRKSKGLKSRFQQEIEAKIQQICPN